MKKLVLIVALVSGISFLASAQQKDGKTPEQKAAHRTEMLQKKLNLSADQTKQVNAIMLTQATRMDSLKTNKSATDKKANHQVRKSIMQQTDQKLSAVLTADQKTTYASLKQNMHKGRRHHNQDGAAAPTNN